MELLIIKNEHVFARSRDDDTGDNTYYLAVVEDTELPAYPTEEAGKGKYWELDYVDGLLAWVPKDRPLTTEERMEEMQNEIDKINSQWKVGENVVTGDRRIFDDWWYTCLQNHKTQVDWTPDVAVSLWKAD